MIASLSTYSASICIHSLLNIHHHISDILISSPFFSVLWPDLRLILLCSGCFHYHEEKHLDFMYKEGSVMTLNSTKHEQIPRPRAVVA